MCKDSCKEAKEQDETSIKCADSKFCNELLVLELKKTRNKNLKRNYAKKLINCTEQSTLEADSSSSSQETPLILCNPKLLYRSRHLSVS
jgi:hypothetical protein